MGGLLGKANTHKTYNAKKFEKLEFAACSMQGWRNTMEDAHIAVYPLEGEEDMGLFAVFDGHGGSEVAIFAQRHLLKCLIYNKFYSQKDYSKALVEAFLNLDELMLSNAGRLELMEIRAEQARAGNGDYYEADTIAGCTANVILVTKQRIYCANAGDSRTVASLKSPDPKKPRYTQLSLDHKPQSGQERQRIQNAGGFVSMDGRINNNLNLSRALGDFMFKANKNIDVRQQIVIAVPDITEIERKETEFVMMGCDGVWETKSPDKMVKWIKRKKASTKNRTLSKILAELMDQELASGFLSDGIGYDNMTAILIYFYN